LEVLRTALFSAATGSPEIGAIVAYCYSVIVARHILYMFVN
jgi:hypothetical protein